MIKRNLTLSFPLHAMAAPYTPLPEIQWSLCGHQWQKRNKNKHPCYFPFCLLTVTTSQLPLLVLPNSIHQLTQHHKDPLASANCSSKFHPLKHLNWAISEKTPGFELKPQIIPLYLKQEEDNFDLFCKVNPNYLLRVCWFPVQEPISHSDGKEGRDEEWPHAPGRSSSTGVLKSDESDNHVVIISINNTCNLGWKDGFGTPLTQCQHCLACSGAFSTLQRQNPLL